MFGTLVENDGGGGMRFAVRGRVQRPRGMRDYSSVVGGRSYGNAFPDTSEEEYESWGRFARFGDTASTAGGATPGTTDWLTAAVAAGTTVEADVLAALGKGTPNTTGNCSGATPYWSALAGRCFGSAADAAAATAAIQGAQTSSWMLPLGLGLGGLVLFFVLSRKKG